MFQINEKDRNYLENKYHKTDEPFNPFNRMAYHGYEYDASTGLCDEEMRRGLSELYGSIKDLPHPVLKARAFEYVLDHTRIDVNECDYFIGIYSWNRAIDEITLSKWHREVFDHIIPETQTFIDKNKKAGTLDIWPDYDHSVPDWDALFTLGFPGILERAKKYRKMHENAGPLSSEQASYFDSIEIEYTAIIRLIDRLYRYAKTKSHEKAKKISVCLEHLRDGAPQNTYEVLQLIYLYFILCECVEHFQVRSLASGLDIMLYPYFKKDIESGNFTKKELCEYIAYFLMQFSAIGNYWGHPFYMGGTGENGESLVNELSYTILDIYRDIDIYNPKIQIKVNDNTPKEFIRKIMDMIRSGRNSFVFMCEPAIMKSMMSLGVTYNEARTCDIKGCYEFAVRAGEVSAAPIYLNLLKPVNLVFNDGVDTITGETVGLHTGGIEAFPTFDDFYKAYFRQLEYILDGAMKAADRFERYLDYINPSPMFSATITSSLECMKDGYAFGSKYNNTVVLHTGFASAIDSLMAVKHFVYDNKTVSLSEMKNALANDWNGYERLRAKILNFPKKFGNHEAETDLYATALSRWLCMKENMRPNARGGVYKSAMHSARHFIIFGDVTEATPDGRKRGDELSKNISPVMGMDKNGVTALVHSATVLDPSLYTENFCLDVMLHPSAVSGEDGLSAMSAILDTYMKNNGLSIQFNVFHADTLKDAQKHPEKYKNLQVRVCGWNVLFHNLSREEQDMYIKRAENIE